MTNIQAGRTWSDERHKVRIDFSDEIDRIVASATSPALTPDGVEELLLEVVAAHYAWDRTPEEAGYYIGRLARRIRAGERLEL